MFIRALSGRWLPILLRPDEGAGGAGGEGGQGGGGDGGAGGGDAGKTFTQAELDQIVKDRLGRERTKYGDYDALKAKAGELDQLKAASQSDVERITGERDTLKGQNGTLSAQNMRLKVALEKGLVGDKAVLAERLTGETEEAMKADADELLKLFGGGNTGFDGGARGSAVKGSDMDALIRRAAGRS